MPCNCEYIWVILSAYAILLFCSRICWRNKRADWRAHPLFPRLLNITFQFLFYHSLNCFFSYAKIQNAGQFIHRLNVSMVSQRRRSIVGEHNGAVMIDNEESGRQLEDE